MKVKIDLQDGFYKDEVEIVSGKKVIYKNEDVNTRFQIGLAQSVEIELKEKQKSITVKIPSKNIEEKIPIDAKSPNIGISINEEGKLSTRVSEDPFGYV